ncbi:hypothetical protein [Archangium minus]|uniref:hypothetical protein n=1 Tax=Archangium minus TaxID=83450 RepID=UPI0037C15C29
MSALRLSILRPIHAFIAQLRPGRSTLFNNIIVSVTPATGNEGLHGIVVVGTREGATGQWHTSVLEDLSLHAPEPTTWANVAVDAVHRWKHLAPPKETFVLAETNTGGAMVESIIRSVDVNVEVRCVRSMR